MDYCTRQLEFRAGSANEAELSLDATLATDGMVRMRSGFDPVDEVLSMHGLEHPSRVPLLNSHDRSSINSVLGHVERIADEGNGKASGHLVFDKNDRIAKLAWSKARDGHVTDVSVGYVVREAVTIDAGERAEVNGREYEARDVPLRVATRWELREVSLVPIGADPAAKIRSWEATEQPAESPAPKPAEKYWFHFGD